jgi:hypothetical protein
MKVHFSCRDSGAVRWQQRGVEHLRRGLQFMQGLLAVDRQPKALALIPIRSVQPHVTRQRHQRTGRD